MKNEKIHSMLLALVGGYVLFLAYEIYGKYKSGAGEMSDALYIGLSIFFVLAGIAVIFYAWKVHQKYKQEEKKKQDETEKPKNALTATDEEDDD